MRKATSIILPVLAVALLAAMAALWPLEALAGPPYQATPSDPSPPGGGTPTPDSGPAQVQGLVFLGSPLASSSYAAGESIRIAVKFDRNVHVSGTPQLTLNIGAHQRQATYSTGSNSRELRFAYVVQSTDFDEDGVSIPANAIHPKGGAIWSGEGGTTPSATPSRFNARLTHSAVAGGTSHKVLGSSTHPLFVRNEPLGPQIYTRGTAITDLYLPSATGGEKPMTYSLSPQPPVGLVFNTTTRVLSGTPTTAQDARIYNYTATDTGGDANTLRLIIAVDGTPAFATASDVLPAQTYTKGTAIANWVLPAAAGGNGALTYTLAPAPPDGLVFSPATRVISGTPTTTQNAVSYTYTVTDADGDTDRLSLAITVDGAPSFPGDSDTLPAQTYAKGAAIATRTFPTAADGNTPLTYSLTPAPPDGLVFNAAARTISGKPTTTQNAVSYTYTVTDADGDTDTLSLDITVDGAPSFPADAVGAQTYVKGVAITRLGLPAATDGNTPLNYTLTPALPDGLVFDTATRTITGTPTTTQNAVSYTYTVTDADGDTDTQSFAITVDGAPSFASDAAVGAQTYPKGVAITSLTLPAATDGNTPLTYSLSPTPPDGLVFNAATRTLSGTPTAAQASTSYTYTVTDADGDTDTLSFTIEVTGDYDADNDQLIEVDSLAQLDAIRWDLNGDGAVDTGTSVADTAKYTAAFPRALAGMGCKPVDHDDDADTALTPVCIGYELTKDLDFDTDGDGATYTTSSTGVVSGDAGDAYYNGGKGWKPIGNVAYNVDWTYNLTKQFTGTFDGNGNTISNLFIKDTTESFVGLFCVVGPGGRIEHLGVRDVNVTGPNETGGLMGFNYLGTIRDSYATGSVTGRDSVGGLVGNNWGTVNTSYATSSVIGNDRVGGLAGTNSGTISASYATGSVTGAFSVGGLVGDNWNGSTISASYATSPVTGNTRVGGLLGNNLGNISASYATGSVAGTSNVGGLVGAGSSSRVTASYWDTGTTGQSTSAGGAGKTTRDLQWPTGYSGIYAAWNTNLDGVAGNDAPWDFGSNGQYPALRYGGLVPGRQWPISVSTQSVNGNIPIVGGPVTATVDTVGATGITWQWQSSADGSAWTDIANATGATYIPVAADAASGGKHLRARASFTASGESQTLTTHRTAKVVSDANVPVIAVALAPIVGEKLRYPLAAGATHRTAWQWRRCDDAAMTSNCVLRAQSNSASDAHTEYTPVAGSDTDVGKYLQAYAYYTANDVGKTWTRTETPVLGPVVAAPAAPTVSQ